VVRLRRLGGRRGGVRPGALTDDQITRRLDDLEGRLYELAELVEQLLPRALARVAPFASSRSAALELAHQVAPRRAAP